MGKGVGLILFNMFLQAPVSKYADGRGTEQLIAFG